MAVAQSAARKLQLFLLPVLLLLLPLLSAGHWGQGLVFRSGTLQIHRKEMDNVPALIPVGSCQLHLKFPLPVYPQFADSDILKDILSVLIVYLMYFTSSKS